jgi:hypothetical protein
MKKQDILDIVNQLPDDVEIDLVVATDDDNTEVEQILVNRLDESDCRMENGDKYPAELVFVLGDGYIIDYEREGA